MNAHWNVLLSWGFGTQAVSGTIWLEKNIAGYHGNNYYIMMCILGIFVYYIIARYILLIIIGKGNIWKLNYLDLIIILYLIAFSDNYYIIYRSGITYFKNCTQKIR